MAGVTTLETDGPRQLMDDIGAAILSMYSTLEVQLQVEIARRLYADLAAGDQDIYRRLNDLRSLEDYTRQKLAELDPQALAATVVSTGTELGVAAALAQIGDWAPRALIFTPTQANAAAAIQYDMARSLTLMHNRIMRAVPDLYRDLTAEFIPNLILGGSTWQQTQRAIVEKALAQGIHGFTDVAGRRWRIGTYAEMVTRTSTRRAMEEATIARLAQSGINLVTPVGRASACPKCRPWHGKVLSTDGFTGPRIVDHVSDPTRQVIVVVDATIETARAAGLGHPNCHDVMVAVFGGAELPVQAPPGFSLASDPAKVGAEARLRRLEVATRDAKRMAAIAGDAATAAAWRAQVARNQAAIRAHVAETGVTRRRYREQLSFADGPPGVQHQAARFVRAFDQHVPAEFSGFVNRYTAEEVAAMKAIYLENGGKTGLLVHDWGDGRVEMTGLFNGSGIKGGIGPLINRAIAEQGVNYAECYGDHLAATYQRYGFKITERYAFDPTMADPRWDSARHDSPDYIILRRE